MTRTKEVTEEHIGQRLDEWLAEVGVAPSRRQAQMMVRNGQVRLNNRVVSKARTLSKGDVVSVEGESLSSTFIPLPNSSVLLDVVYEDAWLVIINKPAGLPCHPLKPHEQETLVNGLLARYPGMRDVGYSAREAGLIHRLDNDTSGALIAAKTNDAFEFLKDLLQQGLMNKRYVALCQGQVTAPLDIALPLRPHPKNRRKMCVDHDTSDVTHLRHSRIITSQPVSEFSLVELSVSKAMRHQIRCHLAALQHPIVGDALYGGPMVDGLTHHFLHASQVGFLHPRMSEHVSVDIPLSSRHIQLLESLRS